MLVELAPPRELGTSTVTRMTSSESCLIRREVMGVECSNVGEQLTSRSHTLKLVSRMKS
jgi:hypothetical protein